MVINMAAGSSEAELQHVIERVIECGFQPHVTRGSERAIVAAVGSGGNRIALEALKAASAHGWTTLLDEYGAKNEGEFFAVATECFFDRPLDMARGHPRLYDLLRDYFRQDPARRCAEQFTR